MVKVRLPQKTTIQIYRDTKGELDHLRLRGESYDAAIRREILARSGHD